MELETLPFVARLVAGCVPFVFGLIGVTVAVSLWSEPFGEFGSPPLFFRIFGTLIASVFMLMGFGGACAAIFGGTKSLRSARRSGFVGRAPRPKSPEGQRSYTCPNCNAALKSKADVSPSGDVRCSYCDRWFNIHRAGA